MDFDQGLNNAIKRLRESLRDSAEQPIYIETLPRLGYRFIGELKTASTPGIEAKGMAALDTPPSPTSSGAVSPPEIEDTPGMGVTSIRKSILWTILAVLVAAGLGTSLYRRGAGPVLTERDTIVLGDFTNSTGDAVFDGTLRQGMAVQLAQSPFLSLITAERTQQVLRLMEKPPSTALTPQISREICERIGSKVVLDGSIAALGASYVLGLRATDCHNGEVLAEEQSQAAKKEDVLRVLDVMAGRMRRRLGESLATIDRYSKPLQEATSSSLDALKAFSQGEEIRTQGNPPVSVPFFRQALQLDPTFALAYEGISCSCMNIMPEEARQNITKAYNLRFKTSAREQFMIEADYYLFGTGELEKAIPINEALRQAYPRDYVSHDGLGIIYRRMGMFPQALEESLISWRMAQAPYMVQNVAQNYINLNRFAEAGATLRDADARHWQSNERAKSEYQLAFLTGDVGRMAQLVKSVAGNPVAEENMAVAESIAAFWYGKEGEGNQFAHRAMELGARNNSAERQWRDIRRTKHCPRPCWETFLIPVPRRTRPCGSHRQRTCAGLHLPRWRNPETVLKPRSWPISLRRSRLARLRCDAGCR